MSEVLLSTRAQGAYARAATMLGSVQREVLKHMLEHPEGQGWAPRHSAEKLEVRGFITVLQHGQKYFDHSLCQITDKGRKAMYKILAREEARSY